MSQCSMARLRGMQSPSCDTMTAEAVLCCFRYMAIFASPSPGVFAHTVSRSGQGYHSSARAGALATDENAKKAHLAAVER